MNDYGFGVEQLFGIYLIFLGVAIYVWLSGANNSPTTGRVKSFSLLLTSVFGMLLFELAGLITADYNLQFLAASAVIMAMCFAATAIFLFTYWFYRADYKMPGYINMLFLVFPFVFAIVALSPLYFMAIEFLPAVQAGYELSVPSVDFVFPGWNIWVVASVFYSYVMLILTAVTAVHGHIKSPKFIQIPSYLMLAAAFILLIGNLIPWISGPGIGINPPIIAATLALLLYRFVIVSNHNNFYARYARLAAFQFLKDLIVIFGKDEMVVDYNPSANKWFSSLGIDLRTHSAKSLIKKLKELDAVVAPALGENAGTDISLVIDGFPIVLNMRTFELAFKNKGKQGTIAFFFDVTQNRELFEKLEKKAGYDMLSGLPNRLAYEGAKQRYDAQMHYPLSVVMGDLNDLKKTNDTLGHKYGDLLIQTASGILEEACPQPLFCARLGGDEFIMLMPNTDEKSAEEKIKKIKAAMDDRSKNLPFLVSMAMGAATKHVESESLEDLIAVADKRLYDDKRVMKGQPPR